MFLNVLLESTNSIVFSASLSFCVIKRKYLPNAYKQLALTYNAKTYKSVQFQKSNLWTLQWFQVNVYKFEKLFPHENIQRMTRKNRKNIFRKKYLIFIELTLLKSKHSLWDSGVIVSLKFRRARTRLNAIKTDPWLLFAYNIFIFSFIDYYRLI